ncbi:MAG TPA: circadian clock KaiB family protein [Verrucomicrobiae bacterium]|nr:circadian clock KaiB family protein [Verrucomicrobiae bacterium]
MKAKRTRATPKSRSNGRPVDPDEYYDLRLYVAGQTPKSMAAFANLKQLCDVHLTGKYRIEVIDLMKKPQRARDDEIIAVPTLVRRLPQPIRKIIGDLCDTQRTLVGLDLGERRET